MLSIVTGNERTSYRLGESIEGEMHWELDRSIESLELRLFWYTQGKGTRDAAVVQTVRVDRPSNQGSQPFHIEVPNGPYSFSGKLISLVWSLELVTEPADQAAQLELTISPDGREVELHT